MQEKGSIHAETEKEDKPYPPGGVCPACGAGAQPGAFDWMRLGRQHDRGGKEEGKRLFPRGSDGDRHDGEKTL